MGSMGQRLQRKMATLPYSIQNKLSPWPLWGFFYHMAPRRDLLVRGVSHCHCTRLFNQHSILLGDNFHSLPPSSCPHPTCSIFGVLGSFPQHLPSQQRYSNARLIVLCFRCCPHASYKSESNYCGKKIGSKFNKLRPLPQAVSSLFSFQ